MVSCTSLLTYNTPHNLKSMSDFVSRSLVRRWRTRTNVLQCARCPATCRSLTSASCCDRAQQVSATLDKISSSMNYTHFTIEERERIQEMLWREASIRTIATNIGRSPSSVSREIRKNYPPEQRRYTPRFAQEKA